MRRPYRRPISRLWWLERRPYTLYVLRELTSVFIAATSLFLLYAVHRIGSGPAEYAVLLGRLRSPVSVALHLLALAAVSYHALTWFTLAPRIAVLRVRGAELSVRVVTAAAIVAWVAFSAGVVALLLRG